MNISDYVYEISTFVNVNKNTRHTHNGIIYYFIDFGENEIIIDNEYFDGEYKIDIKFKGSRKTYRVAELMKLDESCLVELPGSLKAIPISLQVSYFKNKIKYILDEKWCENTMSKSKYNNT